MNDIDNDAASECILPFLFSHKTEAFLFQDNPKNPSYKKDLDFWDCVEEENSI